jgi:cytochrome oxidase Cu insertion factor (SCO1/SenC/PrrC family)
MKQQTQLTARDLFTGAPVRIKKSAYAEAHNAMVYAVNARGVYLLLEGASAVSPLPFKLEQLELRKQ